jgi:hypothetical protein
MSLRFVCPDCGEPLRVARSYTRGVLAWVVATLATLLVVLGIMGVDGFDLFVAFLVAGLPSLYVGTEIALLLRPPPLEIDRPGSLNLFGR